MNVGPAHIAVNGLETLNIDKIQEIISQKKGFCIMKKSLKIIVPILILLIGSIFGYIAYHDNGIYQAMTEQITVSDKTVELQKGDVEIFVNDVINLNNLDCTALFENGNDKMNINAEAVGEQTVKIIVAANNTLLFDKAIELDIKIVIVDTTPPEFMESADEIKNTEGDELNILSKFKAQDLSGEVELTLDGEFDNYKIGEQILKVVAKDINGNIAEKEVKIIVNKKVVASSNNGSSKRNTNNSSNTGNSSSSSSSNASSSSSNSNNNSSSNNGGSSSSNSNQHNIGVGNIGRWFNSINELDTYVDNIIIQYRNKLKNREITLEEYNKKAPTGYESWSCSHCGKYTGNFKYR